MSLRAEEVLAIANQYTDETVEGGGAIKGKNCTIDSIEPISGGQRVTFKWTLDDGTEQTGVMDVPNGAKGDKGDKGDTGSRGPQGETGPAGVGVPEGGTAGQVLAKASGSDYDFAWKDTTDVVRPNVRALVESQAVYSAINNALSSIYTPRGDLSCAELTSALLVEANVGNVYEMSDSGTTSALFINGAGKTIATGDNVGIIKAGADTYLFNLMGNAFDLTDYQKKDLTTPIIVGGVSKSTVEGALGAINDIAGAASGGILPIVDLGTAYTAELKADIASGKFEKAVVGGKLTINNHVYYLAHPDYWLHCGDTECTTHHMLVIPAEGIGTGKMNSSNITTGGYAGSDIKTGNNSNTALAAARAQIIADFGAANILTHREMFTTEVTDGKASSWAWADSDVDLMSEVMVCGCNVWASAPERETGIDKCQLKLFRERPDLITTRASYWLRSVVSETYFTYIDLYGVASRSNASYAHSVRPVFAIK